MQGIPYIGEFFALAAPIAWAFAVILFRKTGRTVPAPALNLFKNVLASFLFLGTLAVIGEPLFRGAPLSHFAILFASGALGIGMADTFYFMALNRIGASLVAIAGTSYSPAVIFMSYLFLGERLSGPQLLGVALILGAVLSVLRLRDHAHLTPRVLAAGVTLEILANVTQAVSIVMIKPLLADYGLIWVNCWRMFGGVLLAALFFPFMPKRREAIASLRNRGVYLVMVPAVVIGTYFSLLFWLAGMKYTLVSVASALNQTSTLWIFVLAVLILREPTSRRRVAGLLIGLAGVALVTFC
ncbi:MAG: DMT family transporter [Candidatus Eisenbacteria bacterium]|nr:DMT family transporter [Candidatus Eisenbacteria bacterium]